MACSSVFHILDILWVNWHYFFQRWGSHLNKHCHCWSQPCRTIFTHGFVTFKMTQMKEMNCWKQHKDINLFLPLTKEFSFTCTNKLTWLCQQCLGCVRHGRFTLFGFNHFLKTSFNYISKDVSIYMNFKLKSNGGVDYFLFFTTCKLPTSYHLRYLTCWDLNVDS